MQRLLKYSLVVAVVLGLNTLAHATRADEGDGNGTGRDNPNNPHTAPEVDPAVAVGGLALLGGTIAVLRARVRR